MLTTSQIEKLKKNWGAKAESMEAMAEVRIYNTLPEWECFVYAMNPEDEDEISVIWKGMELQVIEDWSLHDIMLVFNREGDYPKIDSDFRPRTAKEIFKRLRLNGQSRY